MLLPPSLARLIDRYLDGDGASFLYATGKEPLYLLHGRYPQQPRLAHGLAQLLVRRGLGQPVANFDAKLAALNPQLR